MKWVHTLSSKCENASLALVSPWSIMSTMVQQPSGYIVRGISFHHRTIQLAWHQHHTALCCVQSGLGNICPSSALLRGSILGVVILLCCCMYAQYIGNCSIRQSIIIASIPRIKDYRANFSFTQVNRCNKQCCEQNVDWFYNTGETSKCQR